MNQNIFNSKENNQKIINENWIKDVKKDSFYRIVHVDAGRKYFSPESLKTIICNASEAGFNQVELYLSDNQGFRFGLDDRNIVTSNKKIYHLTPVLGDGYNDDEKGSDGSGKYLTEQEMNELISYAAKHNIEIVPCINVPGHMGTILEGFPDLRYHGSRSSIDLENEEAIEFALALTKKYASYFASHGVKYYNLGADEYANDIGTMGFYRLYRDGKYKYFVEFLNKAAAVVLECGLIPRVFNDGIYYHCDTSIQINPMLQICYWSSGWMDYDLAPAAFLEREGFDLINASGEYYWGLGSEAPCSPQKAETFDSNVFPGGNVRQPKGAMFCIWCDKAYSDGADGGLKAAEDTKPVIAAFGKALHRCCYSSAHLL